jgi:hypothetical protein
MTTLVPRLWSDMADWFEQEGRAPERHDPA